MAQRSSRRPGRVAILAAVLSGCALLRSTPEEVPPPAPSARELWSMPPSHREQVMPLPRVFVARDWLDRLVCPNADQPSWRRTSQVGPLEKYQLDCPGQAPVTTRLDVSQPAPHAPEGLRLLSSAGFERYRAALQAGERKDWVAAQAHIEGALTHEPDEPVYLLARISILYTTGRVAEALVEADALLASLASPTAWKFRALAARDLGLRQELFASLDGLIRSATRRHPMYAEAVCARGLLRTDAGEAREQSTRDLEEGCELRQETCCERLQEKLAAERAAQRILDATRLLKIQLPIAPATQAPAVEPASRPPPVDEARPQAAE